MSPCWRPWRKRFSVSARVWPTPTLTNRGRDDGSPVSGGGHLGVAGPQEAGHRPTALAVPVVVRRFGPGCRGGENNDRRRRLLGDGPSTTIPVRAGEVSQQVAP